ncbi:disease resistance protein RPP2B-like [Rhododendron vialii]|uniref:disease resistance protein RPP2B-like n=1 Tax=Rhododendron vialii TaxID=182163 RepID=UPI00265F91AC|nr:disease resistance protein RPP2B-like [Rhododendron vialii]
MQYSCLKNAWEGTKVLQWLQILNLSHSYDLAKTPNFSEIPNLEKLVLKNCTSLVEVHKSIGLLDKLVLLDCEDCKSLKNLPKSICMLKHLETLIISGCSNLDGLPTNMENMKCLNVLEIDRITLNQSHPTNGQANAVQFFIWPWWLKARESVEISWPSLPRSLVKLHLANCNLSEDDFPRDLSNLCSLKELNLSCNQFCSLPDFIRGLTKIESLYLYSCPRLRKLDGIPSQAVICHLHCGANRLLEEVTIQMSHRPETLSIFKLESIENVEVEIVNNLALSNFQSMGNLTVKLTSWMGMQRRRFPLQVCYESRINCAYIPGSTFPPGFTFKNLGSAIDVIVPSYLNSRIRGLNVCSVYEHFGDPKRHEPHTVISNRTKGLVWSYCPFVFGTAEDGEDTMWLSYWKFGKNHLGAGDEVNISVSGGEFVQVKEVEIRYLYKDEPEEMSSQSAYEDEIPHQLYQFGNIVPGIVSAHQPGIKLYQLGNHLVDCKYCKHLYPPPWIPAPYEYDYNLECWASVVLMVGEPFYVSKTLNRRSLIY